MNNSTKSTADGHPTASAWPYALFVPILVLLAHDAYASMTGWSFRNNALVVHLVHPIILAGMAVIALISYFVIRPFRDRLASRWVAFLSCAAAFSAVLILLMPKLAE